MRYALLPIFDMPIEIANPEQPLGTHVFTAMEVLDDGARMLVERHHDSGDRNGPALQRNPWRKQSC